MQYYGTISAVLPRLLLQVYNNDITKKKYVEIYILDYNRPRIYKYIKIIYIINN